MYKLYSLYVKLCSMNSVVYLFRNSKYIHNFLQTTRSKENYGECVQGGNGLVRSFAILLTGYLCSLKAVFVLQLYKRLLIVVFMFVVNHAF